MFKVGIARGIRMNPIFVLEKCADSILNFASNSFLILHDPLDFFCIYALSIPATEKWKKKDERWLVMEFN